MRQLLNSPDSKTKARRKRLLDARASQVIMKSYYERICAINRIKINPHHDRDGYFEIWLIIIIIL